MATATFGGGCFWCTEAVYARVRGVSAVVPGYAGGADESPTYEAVCTGSTGHAEVVQLTYDPDEVSFDQLLEVFFRTHDPTTLNRQGNDVGTQYRSVVFAHDEEQRDTTNAAIERLNASEAYGTPIVTEVVHPAPPFHAAEAYHHDYFARNPEQSYCAYVIGPKVEKFEQVFAELRREP